MTEGEIWAKRNTNEMGRENHYKNLDLQKTGGRDKKKERRIVLGS